MTSIPTIASKLTTQEASDLALLCFTNGRLRADDNWPKLPAELTDHRHQGGLFPNAYPSEIGRAVHALRTHLEKEASK